MGLINQILRSKIWSRPPSPVYKAPPIISTMSYLKAVFSTIVFLVAIMLQYGYCDTNDENVELNYYREGDMLFAMTNGSGRAGIEGVVNHPEYGVKWSNNRIPYEFDETVTKNPEHQKRILQAMQDLMDAIPNCYKFEPKTEKDGHWVKITNNGRGCSSAVGNQSWSGRTPQRVKITEKCRFGSMVHEFIHTLGFFHEQTRDDRDGFVTVVLENIEEGHEHNFRKDGLRIQDVTGMRDTGYNTSYYGVKYNYDSIMHYPLTAFSQNGVPTMIHQKNQKSYGWEANPGQRYKLSEGDLRMISKKYGCKMPRRREFMLTFSEDFPDDVYEDEYDTNYYNPTTTTTTPKPDNAKKPCKKQSLH